MSGRRTVLVASLVSLLGLVASACGGGEQTGAAAPAPPQAATSAAPAEPPVTAEAAASPVAPAEAAGAQTQLPPGHPPIGSAALSTIPSHAPIVAPGAGNMGALQGAAGSEASGGGAEPTWTVPAGWQEVTPTSPMRKAQYRVPAAAGDSDDGECVVYYFGAGQGGDVRSNVDRWASQFTGWTEQTKPTSSEMKLGSVTVTRVEATGTYHGSPMGMGGGAAPIEKPGYKLLGAIIPGSDANWFLKCTGPAKTMTANRAAFDGMVGSIRINH